MRGNNPEIPRAFYRVIKRPPEIIKRAMRRQEVAADDRRWSTGDPRADAMERRRHRRVREQIASEFSLPARYRSIREELKTLIQGEDK